MPRSELTALFDMMRGAPQPATIQEMRAGMEMFAGFINANPPAVGRVAERVPIADGVRADVIVPPGEGPFPTLIYLHGGGWSIGSPTTHAKIARQLCAGAGAVVVNVEYRLAPEHPFPVPLEDCVRAARWTRDNIATYGGDPRRIAIGGDSAGGNLSAAVINDLRGEIAFRGAVLIYGAFDLLAGRRDYDHWAPEEYPGAAEALDGSDAGRVPERRRIDRRSARQPSQRGSRSLSARLSPLRHLGPADRRLHRLRREASRRRPRLDAAPLRRDAARVRPAPGGRGRSGDRGRLRLPEACLLIRARSDYERPPRHA